MQQSSEAQVGAGTRRVVGRYVVYGKIAAGGMAVVHLGRVIGARGFARTVAVKRLHEQFAADPHFAERFVEEARIVSRIRHPNVVPTLDVVSENDELLLVMEYVHGEALSRLLRRARETNTPVPLDVASAILVGTLHGLHAAHIAQAPSGEPLGVVHRDVSPQNILVGIDGVPRLLDFGIAKAIGDTLTPQDGGIIGKLAYMAPEQIARMELTPRTDLYAASVVLWETLTQRRLFRAENEGAVIQQVLIGLIDPPSRFTPGVSEELDALVLRGLSKAPADRFSTARDMALELERCLPPALPSKVAAWVEALAGEQLAERAAEIAKAETDGFDAFAASSPHTITVAIADASVAQSSSQRRRRPVAYAAVAVAFFALLLAVSATIAIREKNVKASPSPPVPSVEAATAPFPPGVTAAAAPTGPASVASPATSTDLASAPVIASAASARSPGPPPPRRPPAKVTNAKPRCESVDPVTGDIRFNPACR